MVYFITGKSGSGKSSHARFMRDKIEGAILILDGDDVRKYFKTGFSDEERKEHILRIAKIAAIAELQGIVVIIAMIAPRKRWRQAARKLFKKSEMIYLSGGTLWDNTIYEKPDKEELKLN